MQRYIGLDVHAASSTLAVISERGKRLRDFPIETNGQALVEAIRAIAGSKHVILEEGTQSAWLYEILGPHVEEIVVAGVTRSRGQKNDKIDAYALAEKLRVGAVAKRIFKGCGPFTALREHSRTHAMLAGDVVRVQARLKSLYRSRGIPTPGAAVYGQRGRGQWIKQLPRATRTAASQLYDQLDLLVELKEKAEAELIKELGKHSIARVLQTAPGFGPIRVARLLSVVITPHRFRTKRQFWSYCGLGIVMRSSSDWVRAVDGRWLRAQVQPGAQAKLVRREASKNYLIRAAAARDPSPKLCPCKVPREAMA
jgi:transposase